MKYKNKWIVCFGSEWNAPSVYTEHHLINKLHKKGNNILWIDRIPNRNLTIRRSGSGVLAFFTIVKHIKKRLKFISKNGDNFYIYKPFYIPKVEGEDDEKRNNILIKIQLKIFFFLLRIKNPTIISASIIDIPNIFLKIPHANYIHISGDLYSDYEDISQELREKIREKEKRIFNYANCIFAASNRTYNKISKLVENKSKVIYFPHGVDYNHFSNFYSVQKEMTQFRKPIAGYFGSLTNTDDQRIYKILAINGFSVVLIGEMMEGDYTSLKNFPNIYFLGPISFTKIPTYAQSFDVCIIAKKQTEWIMNCNPQKTLEYLALGKPVVSSIIPELQKNFGDLIYFAETPEEFLDQCKLAIENDSQQLIKLRKERAEKENWDNRFDKIMTFLE